MEGESPFNDGTALVLVATTASLAAGLHTDAISTARSLILALGCGVAFGLVFGLVGAMVLRATPDHLTAVLVTIVVVFGAALSSEHEHASSVIAVVIVGLVLGRAARRSLGPSRVLALQSFWETIGFALNVIIFLLVGMQLDAGVLWAEAPSILIAVVAMHAGRALAVYGSFGALRLVSKDPVPMRWQHVMMFGNIKGALSMAAVLALPDSVPFKERLVTIVFGVTVVTLVGQALPFRRALLLLGVVVRPADQRLEDSRTRLVAARSGQAQLDELLAAGLISRRAHAERKAALQRDVLEAEAILRASELEGNGAHIDLAVLDAQRGALRDAVQRGILEAEAVEAQLEAIDERILAIREKEH
jgi:CPA1 family monovalent cation:H+ antiporter